MALAISGDMFIFHNPHFNILYALAALFVRHLRLCNLPHTVFLSQMEESTDTVSLRSTFGEKFQQRVTTLSPTLLTF